MHRFDRRARRTVARLAPWARLTLLALALSWSSAAHAGLIGVNGDSTIEGGWGLMDQLQPYGPMEPIVNGGITGDPVGSVATSLGLLVLAPIHLQASVGEGWSSWSHDFAGEVLRTPGFDSALYLMPGGTGSFDGYLQPGVAGLVEFTITGLASDGSTVELVKTVSGAGGASHFGFYATEGAVLTQVSITGTGAEGFAVAELRLAPVPTPGAVALLVAALIFARPERRRPRGG